MAATAAPTAQQSTTVIAPAFYSAPASGAVVVPSDHNVLQCSVDRASLPAAVLGDIAEVRIDLSLDGGITWSPDPKGEATWPWGGFPLRFTFSGGPSPVTTSLVRHTFLAAANQQLRATLSPLSPTTTSVTITTANGAISAGAVP